MATESLDQPQVSTGNISTNKNRASSKPGFCCIAKNNGTDRPGHLRLVFEVHNAHATNEIS